MVLLALGLGLWIGWHKDAISARLSTWHGELTQTAPSSLPSARSSPSPIPLRLPESPVEAVVETPAPWPSLVDQLLREGIELRDRGDTTTAVDRLKEALDSEPNNAAVLAELAKTYDRMQLYDHATELWRKIEEIGPSAGVPYELADQRLKREMPSPASAPVQTATESPSREVSTSPSETPAGLAKFATTSRESEIAEISPQPTSTALEVPSPARLASPTEPSASAETAAAQHDGRLIVLRAPSFGWNLALNLKIDGKTVANIVQGGRYDESLSAGRHTLTVSAVPNYQPTSTVLNVQHGQTYVFTATRSNTDSVVLVPSAQRSGERLH